jgi:hypothetical protein
MARPLARLVVAAAVLAALGAVACSKVETPKIGARILGSQPADGATDVPITSTTVEVLFDADLDAASVDATTVRLNEGGTGGAVPGDVSYDAARRMVVWTLRAGAALNPLFPSRDVFAFSTGYTIAVDGVRSSSGWGTRTFSATFTTEAMRFGVVAAASDPKPGATDAAIDPERVLVGGALVDATVRFAIDVALDPTTVTLTGNPPAVYVRVDATGATVAGSAAFDPATNTILWAPTATAGANAAYPGEPLLALGTAYDLVVTSQVRALGGAAAAGDLVVPFTTASVAIRAPVTSTATADLVLNEIMANPSNTADTNGDGVVQAGQDEFVEIVNVSSDYLDLNGFMVHDATTPGASGIKPWFQLALAAGEKHRGLLGPGRALVVFGGGQPSLDRLAPGGHAKVFAGEAKSNAQSRFNNGLVGSPPAGSIVDTVRVLFNTPNGLESYMIENYCAPVPMGASLVRSPETTGPFVDHTTVGASGDRFSPGTRADRKPFP